MDEELLKGEEKKKKESCPLKIMKENKAMEQKAQPEDRAEKMERLRKNYQFQEIYRKGRSRATARTVLYFRKNREKYNRLGIVVSKKVGKSVVRHRLKRLYREAMRSLQDQIHGTGYDLIIIARKGADKLTYKEAIQDLRNLMLRGKLIS
ncbi:MAG: ribonuclease P protein component [Dethiobacteria bacterium]